MPDRQAPPFLERAARSVDGAVRRHIWPLVLISAAVVLTYSYFRLVELPGLADRVRLHGQMLAGTAKNPYSYRILVPFVAEGLLRLFNLWLPHDAAFLGAYLLIDLAALYAGLTALAAYLRKTFPDALVLVGVLFLCATLPMTLRDHFYQPWSVAEFYFFCQGLLWIQERRNLPLAGLVLLAALNRETAVFLVLVAFLEVLPELRQTGLRRFLNRPAARWLVMDGLTFAGVFLLLRVLIGSSGGEHSLKELLQLNLQGGNLAKAVFNHLALWGIFWWFMLRGYRLAPPALQRAAWVLPVYAVFLLVFGRWDEVRLWLPMVPVMLPLALVYLQHALPGWFGGTAHPGGATP